MFAFQTRIDKLVTIFEMHDAAAKQERGIIRYDHICLMPLTCLFFDPSLFCSFSHVFKIAFTMCQHRAKIHSVFQRTNNKPDIHSVEQLLKSHVVGTEWGSTSACDFRNTSSLSQPPATLSSPSLSHKSVTKYKLSGDVRTTPSICMLAATITTTLADDVFPEGPTTLAFEHNIATRCRLPASAFVITGTMANQLGLRTLLTQPPHAILTASHSHIVENEAGGPAFLSGAMMQTEVPKNGLYLTLEDIKQNAVLTDNVHKCPTRVVALENTISGIVVPLEEMRRISSRCR